METENKNTQPTDVKTLIENIEKGVKESGTKIEGFNKDIAELKGRMDEFELKDQRINTSPKIEVKDNHFEGQKQARLWKAGIVAEQEKKSRMEILEKMYGRDKDFINEVKAMSASGNAGINIDEQYFSEIIPLLYNTLSVITLGAKRVPMPKGNLNVRKMISGTTAQYIGEGNAPTASKAVFAGLRLSSKKLSVKTIFSNDLLRSDNPTSDQMVRDDLIEQMQIAMDYTALYGKGTQYTPRGIKNTEGVNKVNKSSILDGDTLYGDLIKPIKKANIKMRKPGWIFNPDVFTLLYNETFTNGNWKYRDQLLAGKFHGFPFIETNQVDTGTDNHGLTDIFFGDFDKLFIGEQVSLEVKTSEEASYTDENGITRSAFDNDETVVKGLMEHDMGLAYGAAFSVGNYYTK